LNKMLLKTRLESLKIIGNGKVR